MNSIGMNQELTVRARGKQRTETLPQQPMMEEEGEADTMEQNSDGNKFPQANGRYSIRTIVFVTHFNIFLYSTCFWIQLGTLPVSMMSWSGKFMFTMFSILNILGSK